MSGQPVIDGLEFASARASLKGTVPVSGFPRLRDVLALDAGEIAYSINGERDEQGRPALQVSVRGTLQLRCQRCLEAMPYEIELEQRLVLAATQAEIDAERTDPAGPDRVLAGKEMAVRELIEDELILAVPFAPRHENCAAHGVGEVSEAGSPFANLRGLMRKN